MANISLATATADSDLQYIGGIAGKNFKTGTSATFDDQFGTVTYDGTIKESMSDAKISFGLKRYFSKVGGVTGYNSGEIYDVQLYGEIYQDGNGNQIEFGGNYGMNATEPCSCGSTCLSNKYYHIIPDTPGATISFGGSPSYSTGDWAICDSSNTWKKVPSPYNYAGDVADTGVDSIGSPAPGEIYRITSDGATTACGEVKNYDIILFDESGDCINLGNDGMMPFNNRGNITKAEVDSFSYADGDIYTFNNVDDTTSTCGFVMNGDKLLFDAAGNCKNLGSSYVFRPNNQVASFRAVGKVAGVNDTTGVINRVSASNRTSFGGWYQTFDYTVGEFVGLNLNDTNTEISNNAIFYSGDLRGANRIHTEVSNFLLVRNNSNLEKLELLPTVVSIDNTAAVSSYKDVTANVSISDDLVIPTHMNFFTVSGVTATTITSSTTVGNNGDGLDIYKRLTYDSTEYANNFGWDVGTDHGVNVWELHGDGGSMQPSLSRQREVSESDKDYFINAYIDAVGP
jgi:hypothetical protein